MNTVAKFYKVSLEQFIKDYQDTFKELSLDEIKHLYEDVKLPKRATKGSAGYDFFAPFEIQLKPQETIKVPTGIKVEIKDGWFLAIFPRSGLGFKYRLQLNNTVGIIDADYILSDNEGHIFLKLTNDTNENRTVSIKKGEGLAQGIFMQFGICEDDNASEIRNGGFGSTSKN